MKAHHNDTILCGLCLIAVCLFIRYHIGRRRFNRRGIGGLQHFCSYRKMLAVLIFETVLWWIAHLLGLVGFFLLSLAMI